MMQVAYDVVIFKFMPDEGLGALVAANINNKNKYDEQRSDEPG